MCKKVKLTGLLLLMAAFVLPVKADTAEKKADTLISLKGAEIQLGGELEIEFRDTQKDDKIADPNPRFQFDKFVLKPEVTFKDSKISLKGKLNFKGDKAEFAEGGVCFKNLPLNSQIFTGLKGRFIGISRKTEVYPPLGTALWRGGQLQINWEAKMSPFYWGVSFGEGLRLGTKQVSEDKSYPMLRDASNVAKKTGHFEYGIKLGVKPDIGDFGTIDVLGFGFWGELSDKDIKDGTKDGLQNWLPNYTSTARDMTRYGGRLVYKLKGLTLVGEYAQLKDGALERDGFYLQGSNKWKFKRTYFCSFEPLIRYGQLNTNWEKSLTKPASWDRAMLTPALITELAKNVKLKTEYYINTEKTGGKDKEEKVDNDETLVQLEFKF